jgi:hypothetical protein
MRWIQKERVKGSKTNELRLGVASWDEGDGKEMSIKYTWFNKKDGKASRGGEVPVGALEQMLEFAKKHGYIKK